MWLRNSLRNSIKKYNFNPHLAYFPTSEENLGSSAAFESNSVSEMNPFE